MDKKTLELAVKAYDLQDTLGTISNAIDVDTEEGAQAQEAYVAAVELFLEICNIEYDKKYFAEMLDEIDCIKAKDHLFVNEKMSDIADMRQKMLSEEICNFIENR